MGDAVKPPALRQHVGSWFIVDKTTGETVTEIFRDDPRIHALNTKRYKAVPADVALAALSVRKNPVGRSMKFYITQDGVRRYFADVEAARRAAKRLANQLGRNVTVSYEATAAKGRLGKVSGAGVFSRNPTRLPARTPKGQAAYMMRTYGDNAWQRAKEEALHATRQEYGYWMEVIDHIRERKGPGVYARNPSPTKASKARRKASNKRGAILVYKDGQGREQREKCGNKGIATIKANALKRDGVRGVRVISA